ncbi:MAG: hypothetical protein ACRD3T_15630 [Terriglobia bacterium]
MAEQSRVDWDVQRVIHPVDYKALGTIRFPLALDTWINSNLPPARGIKAKRRRGEEKTIRKFW